MYKSLYTLVPAHLSRRPPWLLPSPTPGSFKSFLSFLQMSRMFCCPEDERVPFYPLNWEYCLLVIENVVSTNMILILLGLDRCRQIAHSLHHFSFSLLCCFVLFFAFLGPHLHIEIPRLGVESELQPPAYPTATATWDPSCVCDLHHRLWQSWISHPISEARNRTQIIMDTSWIRLWCATMETLYVTFF